MAAVKNTRQEKGRCNRVIRCMDVLRLRFWYLARSGIAAYGGAALQHARSSSNERAVTKGRTIERLIVRNFTISFALSETRRAVRSVTSAVTRRRRVSGDVAFTSPATTQAPHLVFSVGRCADLGDEARKVFEGAKIERVRAEECSTPDAAKACASRLLSLLEKRIAQGR